MSVTAKQRQEENQGKPVNALKRDFVVIVVVVVKSEDETICLLHFGLDLVYQIATSG
jgi:hypothetical protein